MVKSANDMAVVLPGVAGSIENSPSDERQRPPSRQTQSSFVNRTACPPTTRSARRATWALRAR